MDDCQLVWYEAPNIDMQTKYQDYSTRPNPERDGERERKGGIYIYVFDTNKIQSTVDDEGYPHQISSYKYETKAGA